MFEKMYKKRATDVKELQEMIKKLTKQNKKDYKWLWIALGSLTLLIGIGAAAWYLGFFDDQWDDWDDEDWDDEDWDFEDDENIIAIDGEAYDADELKENLESSMISELEDGEGEE